MVAGVLAASAGMLHVILSKKVGPEVLSVNPLVGECNDGYLNDIQALAVTEAHALAALDATATEFEVGAVGAGTGMSCFGFKGGIGSASRQLT